MRDITVCVGVDHHTYPQLKITLPNWLRQHPKLRQCEWLVFFDAEQGGPDTAVQLRRELREWGLRGVALCVEPWMGRGIDEYASQRDKMLTGHVYVPARRAETPWLLKIDTDSLCVERKPWPLVEWFQGDHQVIASGWNYTKAKGDGRTIEEWCETLERFGDLAHPTTQRLGLADHIDGARVNWKRFASWICWTRAEFAREVAGACATVCGDCLLPVPSHDTVLWYVLERTLGPAGYLRAKQKRHGWTNVSRTMALAQRAREVTYAKQ